MPHLLMMRELTAWLRSVDARTLMKETRSPTRGVPG